MSCTSATGGVFSRSLCTIPVSFSDEPEGGSFTVAGGQFYCRSTGGEAVAEYWRSRWLASRLDHAPMLDELAKMTPESLRVSCEWNDAPPGGQRLLF